MHAPEFRDFFLRQGADQRTDSVPFFGVIDIPDYTFEEKKIIFSKFALPKVLKRYGNF